MSRNRIILLHILMWTLLVSGNVLRNFFSGVETEIAQTFIIELGYDMVAAICFYLSYFLVAPVLIIRRKFITALLLAAIIYIIVVCSRYVLEFWFLKPIIGFDNYRGKIPGLSYYLNNVFYFYFPSYFLYGLMYFFGVRWFENNKRQQALHQERLGAELAFLRAQVNPHFLFNTINDIYSLSYQSSPLAPEALLKLSVILRYMLKEGNQEFVPLAKEVEYLDNVIELQQITDKGAVNINFIKEGYVGQQPVASLLFIAFLENAFKHGELHDEENPVEVSILADNHSVMFRVKNVKNQDLKDSTSGIGLKNVSRRLNLIYPDSHKINIIDTQDIFEVELLIKFNG